MWFTLDDAMEHWAATYSGGAQHLNCIYSGRYQCDSKACSENLVAFKGIHATHQNMQRLADMMRCSVLANTNITEVGELFLFIARGQRVTMNYGEALLYLLALIDKESIDAAMPRQSEPRITDLRIRPRL